jgi:predicted permease
MLTLLRRLRARLKYRHFERDLAHELDVHRAMKQDELERSGLGRADARASASRALGNVTLMREDSRSVWIARWLEQGWQDLRYAMRGLRRQPGFAFSVIAILGLSTGLLTTVVVFTDASLLQPWRVPDADGLYVIRPAVPAPDGFGSMRVPEHRALNGQLQQWQGLALTIRAGDEDLTFDNGAAERVDSLGVTANYFDTLGVRLAAGRPFSREEDDFISPADVIVISHRLWQTHLNRDPGVIGRKARMGTRTMTIVGVTPPGYIDGFGSHREVWFPFSLWLGRGTPEGRRAFLEPKHESASINVVGRLRPGARLAPALEELHQQSGAFRADAGISRSRFEALDTRPISRLGNNEIVQVVLLVAAALFLVQLLACANVGNLLLARALARQREMAVRLSLGAGRGRIIRQLLTESSLLIALAAGVGLLLAVAAPSIVIPLLPEWDERPEFYGPGFVTFGILVALMSLSTIVAGLAPALRATRVNLAAVAGTRHGQSRGGVRLRKALLVTQVALATLLLSSAGLLTRGVSHALSTDPGYPVEEFQELTVTLPDTRMPDSARQAFFREMATQTRTPEWPPITFTDRSPIFDFPFSTNVRVPGPAAAELHTILVRAVAPNYFDVLGVPLLAGRMPEPDSSVRELVVNRKAAELIWKGRNPVGVIAEIGSQTARMTQYTVVGIATDLPTTAINRIDPVIYRSTNMSRPLLVVRSREAQPVTRVAALADRLQPGATIAARPLTAMVEDTLADAKTGAQIAWAIGALGLVLATIGAFGVFAYAVEERRREVGIRMALGARASQVVSLVLRATQSTVIIGVIAGAVLGATASTLFRQYLYGLSPFDPIAHLQVAVILAAAAGLATWIPARRATRVNPADTLRAE